MRTRPRTISTTTRKTIAPFATTRRRSVAAPAEPAPAAADENEPDTVEAVILDALAQDLSVLAAAFIPSASGPLTLTADRAGGTARAIALACERVGLLRDARRARQDGRATMPGAGAALDLAGLAEIYADREAALRDHGAQ